MPLIRAARLVIVAALAALLVSCTFNKFAYNQADTVAAWMVDDYVGFDGAQKSEFDKRFARFHAWHRQEQLPEYAQFLRSARSRMQDGLARDEVLWFVDGIRARVRTAGRQIAPDAAALLATLTPAQIDTLQKKLDKGNKKYVKEHKLDGTPAERQQVEAKRVIKQLEDWLVPLTNEQKERVTAMVRELPALEQQRYAERLRRQKALIELLAHRDEEPQRFTARVSDWLTSWEKQRSPEYQRQLDASWQKRADLFVAVERMLTAEQRTAALQRIQGYAEDFTQLARREGTTARTAAAR